jgi:ferredoxin
MLRYATQPRTAARAARTSPRGKPFPRKGRAWYTGCYGDARQRHTTPETHIARLGLTLSRDLLRRCVQIACFVGFALLTVASVGPAFGRIPVNLFSRLDPLVGLGAMVASRAAIGFWAAALVTVALTLVFGRAWCGWICPLGTLLDITPAPKKARWATSRAWRVGKYAMLAIVVIGALIGTLTPMVLDPIMIVTRPLQELLRPYFGTDAIGQGAGADISRFALVDVAFLSLLPLAFVLALNAISKRFWCRVLCPLGGLLGLLSHVPGIRRRVDVTACRTCGACARSCPTSAIDADRAYASGPGECIDCLRCEDACPVDAISFHSVLGETLAPKYRPERRDAFVAAGATALGVAVVAVPSLRPSLGMADEGDGAEILRPPSTDDRRLAALCVRCGACYGACPTGALKPSLSLTSAAGPWTPSLDVRPVHCTLNCNRCARVCPTDALHTPTAAEAQALGLGAVAHIDKQRCRAWAKNRACLACMAVCPIIGAIKAVERPADLPTLHRAVVSVPEVDESLCVGCDVCARTCPIGPAAIGTHLEKPLGPNGPSIPEMIGIEPSKG